MNTPEQNIINTLKGKRVLFVENDSDLDDERLKEFARILDSAEIQYEILCDVQDLMKQDMNLLTEPILKADAIVFMTQWVYEVSRVLESFIAELPTKKTIVEVYVNEPSWYYASQHGTHHDVYIYTCSKFWSFDSKEFEKFYKLTDEPYWNYANKFDK
jgi:hypothetical protein